MPDLVVHEEEVYDDEDDENDETNWRNDYPEDESDSEGDKEERYGGVYLVLGRQYQPKYRYSQWTSMPAVNKSIFFQLLYNLKNLP